MKRALRLAAQGRGSVEPNPMVGCVIVNQNRIVGEGFHAKFGGAHAEVAALNAATAVNPHELQGATAYVTLEPCCHHGKTPPCTEALIRAGVRRVVVAHRDPFPRVDGGGIQLLREAGIDVEVGLCEQEAAELLSPYLTRLSLGRPWVIAKWAMTLDGSIATRTNDSRWISNHASRSLVHELRGRVDAVIVGRATVDADDPLLTARPPGKRRPTRIVFDSNASIPSSCKLLQTAREEPLLVFVDSQALAAKVERLSSQGAEVVRLDGLKTPAGLSRALKILGSREMTNVLVEGGGQLLGSFHDAQLIDELHVFVAPKIFGGSDDRSPLRGIGIEAISDATQLENLECQMIEGDIYLRGRTKRA